RTAAQALRLEQGVQQLGRQSEALQLHRLERDQALAELLPRLGIALALRATRPRFLAGWIGTVVRRGPTLARHDFPSLSRRKALLQSSPIIARGRRSVPASAAEETTKDVAARRCLAHQRTQGGR